MSETTTPNLSRDADHDISDHADVEALLRRFYGQVLVDDLLAEPFTEVRRKGLEAHLPVMCDFWETVLFSAGLYTGKAMLVHQAVHNKTPLVGPHFIRWLTLWRTTVDEMFEGPNAEHAKVQASRVAWAFHRRFTGTDCEELNAFVDK